MRKFRYNIIHRVAILVLSLTVLSIAADNYNFQIRREIDEISQLHNKIGVVKIEPLHSDNDNDFSKLLLTSVINSDITNKNYKEIIVKYNNLGKKSEFVLKIDSALPEEKLSKIYKSSLDTVDLAEPNYAVKLENSDPVDLQNLKLNQPKLDDQLFLKRNPKVAVIDSGIDVNHPKLKENIEGYKNVSSDSKTNEDLVGHGTHIAGIIVGLAPTTKIVPIKFTDGKIGRLSDLLRGLDYAIESDVEIINLSLGILENSKLLKTKIDEAVDNDIIVVAAAGNQNSTRKFYPAALDEVVSVAALNNKGEKMFASNYGDWVDFATYGQDIYSTYPKNSYKYWSGTSQAAARLTGLILANTKNSDYKKTIEEFAKFDKTEYGRLVIE